MTTIAILAAITGMMPPSAPEIYTVPKPPVVAAIKNALITWEAQVGSGNYRVCSKSTLDGEWELKAITTNVSYIVKPSTNVGMELFSVFSTNCPTQKATLNWVDCDGAGGGYVAYCGTNSRQYPMRISTTNTTATFSNLVVGTRYYFAVTARNAIGVESDYSRELTYRYHGKQLATAIAR
jgi:hypothetical protein